MQPQPTPQQREVLAEVGHFYMMLESHEMAAQHCREQLEQLRGRLLELQQSALQTELPPT